MPWVLIIIINFMWLCKCIFNCAKFCQVHGDAFRYTLSKLLFLDMHRLTVPFLISISNCFKLMHTVELLLRFSSWTCTFLWILCTHKPIIIANKWKHYSLNKYSTWWICQQSQQYHQNLWPPLLFSKVTQWPQTYLQLYSYTFCLCK